MENPRIDFGDGAQNENVVEDVTRNEVINALNEKKNDTMLEYK